MSKAFTRESDDAPEDEAASQRRRSSTGSTNYLTREGADRLNARLNTLLEQKRVLAGAMDAATPDSKAALRRLESEIQELQSTLNGVIIVDPPVDQNKIAMGATVRVRDEDGDVETYQIVGVNEANPGRGRISSASPLGRALLTKQAGDKVQFQSPGGLQELTILSVQY